MTVVLQDLLVRIRSDMSDAQKGSAAAKAGLATVADEAKLTGAALDLMAAKFAKAYGGTAAEALAMFQRTGVKPTADALAQVTAQADKASAALQAAADKAAAAAKTTAAAAASYASVTNALSAAGITDPKRVDTILAAQKASDDAARIARGLQGAGISGPVASQQARQLTADGEHAAESAKKVAEGWTGADSSMVRFASALVGVDLGISLVAGAAGVIHDAVVGTVNGLLDWERSLKTISGLYGDVGARVVAVATGQSNLPNVLGTQQEFAQAAINASALVRRYGLSQGTVDQFTTTGGRLAYSAGLTDPAARAQLQAQILGAVQTGAPLPAQYGIYTDPEAVARRLGFQGSQALGAYTPQQLMQARAAIVNEGGSQFTDRADQNRRAALDAAVAAEKTLERIQVTTQNTLENNGVAVLRAQTPRFGHLALPAPPSAAELAQQTVSVSVPESGGGLPAQTTVELANAQLQGATEEYTKALADSAKAEETARQQLDALAHGAEQAGARLLSFTGSLEDATSIARGDILAQAQDAVTARAQSANPARAVTDAEISAIARGTAAQQAYQNYVAPLAQQQTDSAIQSFLERQAATQGPGSDLEATRVAAQGALAEIPRRQAAQTIIGQTNRVGDLANTSAVEAQAQLDAINLTQEQRRLDVAQTLAGLQTDALNTEGAIAPILREQADLQDRIARASRDNLTSRRELISAEQAALGPQGAQLNLDYNQSRLQLLAESSRASILRGEGPTQDITTLRRQYFQNTIGTGPGTSAPDIALANLDAKHQVDVTQLGRTGEDLARQQTLADLDATSRALDDQSYPLKESLRLTQEKEDSVNRTLALLNLTDVAAIHQAQQQKKDADALKMVVDEIARQAADYAAGMDLGATAAERSANAMAAARDNLKETLTLLQSLPSLTTPALSGQVRDNNSSGYPGNSNSGATISVPISINGQTEQQVKDHVHIAVEDALNNFFSGASTTSNPAPSTVGGAGR